MHTEKRALEYNGCGMTDEETDRELPSVTRLSTIFPRRAVGQSRTLISTLGQVLERLRDDTRHLCLHMAHNHFIICSKPVLQSSPYVFTYICDGLCVQCTWARPVFGPGTTFFCMDLHGRNRTRESVPRKCLTSPESQAPCHVNHTSAPLCNRSTAE